MTLHDFKEKYCRKSLGEDSGEYMPTWFIDVAIKYEDLESDVKSLIQEERKKIGEEILFIQGLNGR